MFDATNLPKPSSDYPLYLRVDFSNAEKDIHELLTRLPDSEEEDLEMSAADLRVLICTTAPELWEVAQKISHLLREGVPAIVVQKLPFAHDNLKRSKLLVLAFASCVGHPSTVDPYSRKRVWEVSPRIGSDITYIPTVTEHNYGS